MSGFPTSTYSHRAEGKTPLGQLHMMGFIKENTALPPSPLRVLDCYGIMYLVKGRGVYRDMAGARPLMAGDLVLVFPEHPHTYAPPPGEAWDEMFMQFSGPLFQALRDSGAWDIHHPVQHLEPIDYWLGKLMPFVLAIPPMTVAAKTEEAGRLVHLLTEMWAETVKRREAAPKPKWLSIACHLLDSELGSEIDLQKVAAEAGMSYALFRHQFGRVMGMPPARYRAERRIDVAGDMLIYTRMTCQTIAETLGFSDEFHLSKRFKQFKGVTPRDYRRRGREAVR